MILLEPHTPKAHKDHNLSPEIPCGCATDLTKKIVICNYCGAAYDLETLNGPSGFPFWTCYDCKNSYQPLRWWK